MHEEFRPDCIFLHRNKKVYLIIYPVSLIGKPFPIIAVKSYLQHTYVCLRNLKYITMKSVILIVACILTIGTACKKSKTPVEDKEVIKGDIKQVIETVNGITYKIFIDKNATNFKGILVLGSGNDENNPSEGAINGASETALCEKAAANGYAAAIVKYQKPAAGALCQVPGLPWAERVHPQSGEPPLPAPCTSRCRRRAPSPGSGRWGR